MSRFNDPREYHRPIWGSLFFTQDGDLDLTWLFVLIMGLVGVTGFLWVVVISPASLAIQVVAWAFLGAAFTSVLIAAIPVTKAKILAKSTLPTDLAKTIASAGCINVETSTDVQEIIQTKQELTHQIG